MIVIFFSGNIQKVKKSKINCNVFYLTQYIQDIIISVYNQHLKND